MDNDVSILLVEDEQLVALVVEEILKDAGFHVVIAHSSAEALQTIQAADDTLKAVVTDIKLGAGATGWDVARRARELNPKVPVVYITGDSIHDYASLGVPASLILQKPFAPAQLIVAISSLINEAQAVA